MGPDLRRGRDAAVRITTASSNREDEIWARQRRYIFSMAVRTVCFLGAILVGPGWLRWVLVAGAVLLPYVAVVMANATGKRSDGFELQDAQSERKALETGPAVAGEDRPEPL
jgi:Protein of unknown function (DUF3099)